MSTSRSDNQHLLFSKTKSYQIETSSDDEFCVAIKHLTLIYEREFNDFATKHANLHFDVQGVFEVKITLVIPKEHSLFQPVDKEFRKIMQFLNNHKLETRDYAEIMKHYEQFLKDNKLEDCLQSKRTRATDDVYHARDTMHF